MPRCSRLVERRAGTGSWIEFWRPSERSRLRKTSPGARATTVPFHHGGRECRGGSTMLRRGKLHPYVRFLRCSTWGILQGLYWTAYRIAILLSESLSVQFITGILPSGFAEIQ